MGRRCVDLRLGFDKFRCRYFLKAGGDWDVGTWLMRWNWMATDPTSGDCRPTSYLSSVVQKPEGQPLLPPLSQSHKPWKPTWVHSRSAFSTDLLQLTKGLLNVVKKKKKKEAFKEDIFTVSKRMCQSIFVSAIESALFPVGCLCVDVCVCARCRPDLCPCGWLCCFSLYQLLRGKIKVTLRGFTCWKA